MDGSSISTLIWTVGILAYGIFEYRRRDRRHRVDMEYLRRGITPPDASDLLVPRWRIVTVAMTALVVIASSGFLIYTGIKHPYSLTLMIVIACIFLSIAAPLVYMVIRDARLPRGRLRRSQ